jgi:TPR repeat protein
VRTRTANGESVEERLEPTPGGAHQAFHARCGNCSAAVEPCARCNVGNSQADRDSRKRAKSGIFKGDPAHQAQVALSNEARRDAYAASTASIAAANEARRATYAEGEAEARRDRYQPLLTHDMNRAAEWRKEASTTGRLNEAVKIYLSCIDQGCARAYFELGCMYSTGEGVEEDKQQALQQCIIASEMGFTDASMALAQAYAGLRLESNSWATCQDSMLLPELNLDLEAARKYLCEPRP